MVREAPDATTDRAPAGTIVRERADLQGSNETAVARPGRTVIAPQLPAATGPSTGAKNAGKRLLLFRRYRFH